MAHHSNAQAPWRLVLLSILTFGLYQIYWFYRNWKHLKIHNNLDIRPGWRTLGLFVPVWNILLVWEQFRDIHDFAEQRFCKTYPTGWLAAGFIVFSGISFWLNFLKWRTTDPTELLGLSVGGLGFDLLGLLLLAVVQRTLNSLWKEVQPELEIRKSFSWKEIALLVIGGTWWALTMIGLAVQSAEVP